MTPARKAVNDAIMELSSEAGNVLFVGKDTKWDYHPYFSDYKTLDIDPGKVPDIVADISSCPEIPDNSFSVVIMVGVYEYLKDIAGAFREINRILKPDGISLLCLPGEDYYKDKPTVKPEKLAEAVSPLYITHAKIVYYKSPVPYYFIVNARKI